MYLISNRQRQEAMAILSVFIEMTADNSSYRIRDLRRRAGLLVKRLEETESMDIRTVKRLKAEDSKET